MSSVRYWYVEKQVDGKAVENGVVMACSWTEAREAAEMAMKSTQITFEARELTDSEYKVYFNGLRDGIVAEQERMEQGDDYE